MIKAGRMVDHLYKKYRCCFCGKRYRDQEDRTMCQEGHRIQDEIERDDEPISKEQEEMDQKAVLRCRKLEQKDIRKRNAPF
jgi:hypothetical protein